MAKGNYSRNPDEALLHAQRSGYVGVRFEQGVPLLDRDLNLMGDLLAQNTAHIVENYIGDGVVDDVSFKVELDPSAEDFREGRTSVPPSPEWRNDFWINGPSAGVVGGIIVRFPARFRYGDQPGLSPAPLLNEHKRFDDGRYDLVYLQASIVEEDGVGGAAPDRDLLNPLDVALRTSTRLKVYPEVRVMEGIGRFMGSGLPGGPGFVGNALLTLPRPAIPLAVLRRGHSEHNPWFDVRDVRPRRLSLATMARRLAAVEDLLRPSITSFGPFSAREGDVVTIKGMNFAPELRPDGSSRQWEFESMEWPFTAVFFGDVRAVYIDASSSEISARVPSGLPSDKDVSVSVLTSFGRAVSGGQGFRLFMD